MNRKEFTSASFVSSFIDGEGMAVSLPISLGTMEISSKPKREIELVEGKKYLLTDGIRFLEIELYQIKQGSIKYDDTFNVEAVGYEYPRGNKLPKTSRLKKKWRKKYRRELHFKNMRIVENGDWS